MLTIVQRGGATREKPPEVVGRQSSRLPWAWDGLCFAVPFNDATRDSARDLVYNVAPSAVTGTLTWKRDSRGNAVAYLDTSSGLEYADTPSHTKPTTALTAYCRIRRAGTPIAGANVFTKIVSTSEATWQIQQADAGDGRLAGFIKVGATYNFWESTYVLPTTTWVSAVLRWRSGSTPVLTILDERGATLDSAPYTSALTGTLLYVTGQPVLINISADGIHWSNNDYSQCMFWSRRLSDTEIQALVSDPYGWYSPRRETIGISSPYPIIAGASEMKFGTASGGLR